ncbi:MAG: CARDB domain-containing protein [Desulfobacteraceae bacterium]
MRCFNRLILAIAAACLLLQMPISAGAEEATKMRPGAAKSTVAAKKTLPPDLVVSKITYSPGKPTAGSGLVIKVFFKNIGRSRAGASMARVKVGGESVPKTVKVPALNIGQEWRYTRKFRPGKPARYLVKATADYPKRIAESNEDNNTRSITISVKKAAKKAMRVAPPAAGITKTPAAGTTPKTMRAAPAKQTMTKAINPAVKHLMKAEITNFEIGTETDGRWFWVATVKNTGGGTIDARRLLLQATQIQFAPAHNPPVAGSGRLITSSIAPGVSKAIKAYWGRCCRTEELSVELRDKTTNKVIDQKSITNLIHSMGYVTKVFDTKITRIEWDNTAKTWQATFQNNTPYYLKMVTQGTLIIDNYTQPVPVGGQRLLIGPNQTKKSMKFKANNAVNGNKIKVTFYFDSDSSLCNQSVRDCGGESGNLTTIPNSNDF